jgi:endonuclease/exonuclease/phosphatase family metal-dependent hydrolase
MSASNVMTDPQRGSPRSNPRDSGAAELRVLTFNLGLLALRPSGRLPLSPHVEARLAAAPHHLCATGADVIALQEVYAARHSRFICDAMTETHPHAFVPRHRGSLLGSGLMFLSRYPITDGGFVACGRARTLDGMVSDKGCLWVAVDVPALGRIRLMTVHLTVGGVFRRPDDDESVGHRRIEIEHALAVADRHEPAILLGDFNCSPTISPENYRRIIAAGYVDAFAAACAPDIRDEAATWDAGNPLNVAGRYRHSPSQRIDHVFVPRTLAGGLIPRAADIVLRQRVVEIGSSKLPLSDHYGLMATLTEENAKGHARVAKLDPVAVPAGVR